MIDDEPRPFYELLRKLKIAVAAMLAENWPIEAIRADLIPRGCVALEEVPEPHYSSLRAMIVRAVDEAICQAFPLSTREA